MDTQPLSYTDQHIATGMLFEVKDAIKDLATAITESSTDEIHTFLTDELKMAIAQHQQIYDFLQTRGIYDAYNVPVQLQKDIGYAKRALNQI